MNYLPHHLLIAMPSMEDNFFSRSVIYLCEHNEKGAMGLTLTVPLDMDLHDLLTQMKIDHVNPELAAHPVLAGGPVSTDRGFVLHPTGPKFQATVDLDGVSLSTSQDVLFAIADGVGPAKSLIALGYAGWEAGQLEAELAQNAWLTCPFDADILFNTSCELRLEAAAKHLGINLSLLTSQAGHA